MPVVCARRREVRAWNCRARRRLRLCRGMAIAVLAGRSEAMASSPSNGCWSSLPPSSHEFQMNVTFTHTHTHRQTEARRKDRQISRDRQKTYTVPPRVRRSLSPRALEAWSLRAKCRSRGGGRLRVRGGRAGHRARGRRALTQSHTDSLAPPAVQSPPRAAKEKLAALSAASRKLFRPIA